MPSDLRQAIGAVLGIGFAGIVLAMIGAEISIQTSVNLELYGKLLVLLSVAAAGLILYMAISAVFKR